MNIWDEAYIENRKPWVRDVGQVSKWVDLVGKGLVIDLGCGSGEYAVEFLKNGCSYVGVDISGEAIKQAKKRTDKAAFYQADLNNIEKINAPKPADILVDCKTLAFIEDKDKYFENIKRFVKPGGVFICQYFTKHNKPELVVDYPFPFKYFKKHEKKTPLEGKESVTYFCKM